VDVMHRDYIEDFVLLIPTPFVIKHLNLVLNRAMLVHAALRLPSCAACIYDKTITLRGVLGPLLIA
jgi:hypothetical protein